MKVLLIRHAQSPNTEVAEMVAADDYGGEEALRKRWLTDRFSDPELTPLGRSEASTLARGLRLEYLASVLDVAADSSVIDADAPSVRCELVCSPMRAALQTAAPLSESLGCQVVVDPTWCEIGGHYGVGTAASAAEIQQEIEGADISMLPAQGPWDTGSGLESNAATRDRAQLAVASLLARAAAADGTDVLLVVSHGGFIPQVLSRLLLGGCLPSATWTQPNMGLPCQLLNTSTTALDVDEIVAAESLQRSRRNVQGEEGVLLNERNCVQLLWLNRVDHLFLAHL
jgi:broad specificity phosphatase PhoE